MSDSTFKSSGRYVVDQYGNRFEITEELARGGQGVVYRTSDADLAVKQPLGPDGRARQEFQSSGRLCQNSLPTSSSGPVYLSAGFHS